MCLRRVGRAVNFWRWMGDRLTARAPGRN